MRIQIISSYSYDTTPLHHNRVLIPIPGSNLFHSALFDELGPTASLL